MTTINYQEAYESLTAEVLDALAEADGQWRNVGAAASYSGGPRSIGSLYQTSVRDRTEGRYAPFYENEYDLRRNVAACRQLATFTAIAIGAQQALKAYTIGGDWEYTAEPQPGSNPAPQLVAEVQAFVDRFLSDNGVVGGFDHEVFDHAVEDGESFLAMYGDDSGYVSCERLEPEQIAEPTNAHRLDQYLGVTGPSDWTFGVHRAYCRTRGRIHHARPLGYHAVFDDAGSEWDYLPTWPHANLGDLSGKCATHYKRNAPIAAARGVSDYWSVLLDLEREDKLMDRTSVGATVQAAIAYIVEHATGATAAQVTSSVQAQSATLANRLRSTNSDTGRAVQHLDAASVVQVNQGKKYHPGPLATANWTLATDIAQALKRRVGVRWLMPEYMISGDASNANYASTLVSESPFVKLRQFDQSNYRKFWESVIWKALKIGCDAGRFARYVGSFAELRRAVALTVTAPDVASRDPLALTNRLAILRQNRVISLADWATAEGLDPKYAEEQEGAATVTPSSIAGGVNVSPSEPAVPAPGESEDLRLNGAQVTAALDVLAKVGTGELDRQAAIRLLGAVGIDPANAARIVAGANSATAHAIESVTCLADAVKLLEAA